MAKIYNNYSISTSNGETGVTSIPDYNKNTKSNILIVDDEKSILDVLISGLSDDGFKCFAAFNANEALDIVKREKIDFSLLDIRLPDMSGIDLCLEIKSLDPSIINIIMTGFPSFKSAVDSFKTVLR